MNNCNECSYGPYDPTCDVCDSCIYENQDIAEFENPREKSSIFGFDFELDDPLKTVTSYKKQVMTAEDIFDQLNSRYMLRESHEICGFATNGTYHDLEHYAKTLIQFFNEIHSKGVKIEIGKVSDGVGAIRLSRKDGKDILINIDNRFD